jgi:hypothetical protein
MGSVRRIAGGSERPRAWLLLAIGLAAFAAGLGIARASLSEPREGLAAGTAPQRPGPAEGARQDAGSTADAGDLPDAASAGKPADAGTAVWVREPDADARHAADGGRSRVEPVAAKYLRCEGLPHEPGKIPCPRDEHLEARVWTAIRHLPQCETPPRGTGRLELQLEFVPGEPTELRVEDAQGASDTKVVQGARQCLERSLAEVETRLASNRLVVSFRFRLH